MPKLCSLGNLATVSEDNAKRMFLTMTLRLNEPCMADSQLCSIDCRFDRSISILLPSIFNAFSWALFRPPQSISTTTIFISTTAVYFNQLEFDRGRIRPSLFRPPQSISATLNSTAVEFHHLYFDRRSPFQPP